MLLSSRWRFLTGDNQVQEQNTLEEPYKYKPIWRYCVRWDVWVWYLDPHTSGRAEPLDLGGERATHHIWSRPERWWRCVELWRRRYNHELRANIWGSIVAIAKSNRMRCRAGHGGRIDKKRYSKRIRNANSYSSKGRPLEIWIDNIEADL